MSDDRDQPIELDEPTARAARPPDLPRMPEPLPVRLVAIEDVRLPSQAGTESAMDDLYVGALRFEKAAGAETGTLTYRADNFAVHFSLVEGLVHREDFRPLMVEVDSLSESERRLLEREIEYTRQRGLVPGTETLLLLDPSGNYLEIAERRLIL